MPLDRAPIEVTICLGSSCFARGNAENLGVLKHFAQAHAGEICLRLTGSLCQENCKQGPNLTIDGQSYRGIHAEQLRERLQQLIRPEKHHGTA